MVKTILWTFRCPHLITPLFFSSLLTVSLLGITSTCRAESSPPPKRWPGYAILGNGNLCAVYSDHVGTFPKSILRGIQHLYYRDYATDCIAYTTLQVLDPANRILPADPQHPDSVGMENFYTAFSRTHLAGGARVETRALAHPNDAIVLCFSVTGAPPRHLYLFHARLPTRIEADRTILMDGSAIIDGGATFSWSSGTCLAIASLSGEGLVSLDDIGFALVGTIDAKPVKMIIAAGASQQEAAEKLASIRREEDPVATAQTYWENWLDSGTLPELEDEILLEAYRRNLYAARAACLNGQIPADITGQFRTHNMPQLYPRDALMCARAFLLAGHLEEARQVMQFWAGADIPQKTPGEWYARYDARAQAVDSGSGARYDEPEWDSNGYVIQLADEYHALTGEWPVEISVLYALADFLVDHIDQNGLLFEGGIVEWSGYLPASNMIAAAALQTASGIAADEGDAARSERYRAAAERISTSLRFMFDSRRGTYADVRFVGGKGPGGRSFDDIGPEALYLWDTSANFGFLWEYPDHEELRSSNAFYAQNCVQGDGGMQYFDAPDPGLSAYGHDLFFFTTAAAAQYQARCGDLARARMHIAWMLANANVYDLMPERVYLNGSGCSQASPLSWCCAELAAALLEYARAERSEGH